MAGEMPPRPIPLPMNFEGIPSELLYPNNWVLWRYVWKEDKQKWDKPPYQPNGGLASSTASFTWSSFQSVKAAYEHGMTLPVDDPRHFDGIGFVPAKSNLTDAQIVFGDLDKCRNKESGEILPDALEDLKLINSYCEPSPSGTGMRFIAKGNPFPPGKDGRKKGGIELYQGGHYLTITGQRLQEYPSIVEKRFDELRAFYEKHFSEPEPEEEKSQKESGPKLTVDQIIALAAQAHNSPKFLSLMDGKYEHFLKDDGERLYPSQSEADLGLCELICFYTTDPTLIDLVFRRSKLYRPKWERSDYCEDTIKLAISRTKTHYNGSGTGDANIDDNSDPSICFVSKDDPKDSVGLCHITGTVKKVIEFEGENGKKAKFLTWVSDCPVYIHTETIANDETEFTFVGSGAVDKRPVKFTMPAAALAEPRKFKAALINAFGAKNRVGELTFEMVQELSLNTRVMQRITVPTWQNNIPLLPGLGIAQNVEYKLSSKILAKVYDGDLTKAKDCLRKLLKVHRYAPILVTTVLGAPAIARWHKNDRFGLGLWGQTGTLKTSTVMAAMGFYGTGYLDGPKLKAGKEGSTSVGAMEVFAAAGFLPQPYDNLKTVNSRDVENYFSLIHSVLEGEEKARGKKDGGLRDGREFNSTPIVTGEVRPEEASTTARVLNLNWSATDGKLLAEVQQNAALLPIIGYHWLRFLANTDFVLGEDFEAYRSKKMEEFLGLQYVNPGRLATIYTLLLSTWDLLEASPLGDVFAEHRESFKTAIEEATKVQGAAVSDETEVARFLSGLEELIASNPGLIMSKEGTKTILGSIIGKWMPEGIFLLPTETLNELTKIKAFTQMPTKDSITQALSTKDLLIRGEHEHLLYRARLNGRIPRGWYIKAEAFPGISEVFPSDGNAENDNGEASVPVFPVFPEKKREKISEKNDGLFGENKKEIQENAGNDGNNGNRDDIDRLVDSDLDGKVSVPGNVPSDQSDGNIMGKIPRPTPTKKPRSYSEMVQLVPFEYASPIEEKLCVAFRGLLARGIAPRLDMVIKETGLSEEVVRCYLDDAPWIRKDNSSPAGIVVYLPSEASA